MAKVGEGDERWIVREREDGANVNGWHWSEKNLTDWAKERLTELLSDLVVLDDSTGSCKVCKLEKMVGDGGVDDNDGCDKGRDGAVSIVDMRDLKGELDRISHRNTRICGKLRIRPQNVAARGNNATVMPPNVWETRESARGRAVTSRLHVTIAFITAERSKDLL